MSITLAEWINEDERVVEELETLLSFLNVPTGRIDVLREKIDELVFGE